MNIKNNYFLFFSFFICISISIYSVDFDGDSISKSWEEFYGFNDSFENDSTFDNDSDLLENVWEFRLGFNPLSNNSDSNLTVLDESNNTIADGLEDIDNDNITNFDEIAIFSTNPLSNDTDNDNLSDFDEINIHNTNPLNNDTDGDTLDDFTEVTTGLDPLINIYSFYDKNDAQIGEDIRLIINLTTFFNFSEFIFSFDVNNTIITNISSPDSFNTSNSQLNAVIANENNLGPGNYIFLVDYYITNNNSLNNDDKVMPFKINFSYKNNNNITKVINTNLPEISLLEPIFDITHQRESNIITVGESFQFNITPDIITGETFNNTIILEMNDSISIINSSHPYVKVNNDYLFNFKNSSLFDTISLDLITNNTYSNNELILARDQFRIRTALLGYSSEIINRSRTYITDENSNQRVLSPNFYSNVSNLEKSIGEKVTLRYFLDFSQTLSDNVSVDLITQNGIIVTNIDTYNDSLSITNSTNMFTVTYGDIITKKNYFMDLEFYINNSFNNEDIVTFNSSLNYYSSDDTQYIVSSNDFLKVVEPNLEIQSSALQISDVNSLVPVNISIDNTGNSDAHNVSFTYTIPDGIQLYNSSQLFTVNNISNNSIRYYYNNINYGLSESILLYLNITSNYSDSLILSEDIFTFEENVTYYSSENESISRYYEKNSVKDMIRISSPTFVKDIDETNNSIGEEFTLSYNLDFSRASSKNISLLIPIPFGLEVKSVESSSNESNFITNNSLTLNYDQLLEPTSITSNVTFFVNNSLNDGNLLNINATINYLSTNNTEFTLDTLTQVLIVEPNISIAINSFSPVSIGDILTYIINISNSGNSNSFNQNLVVNLANGTSLISSSLQQNLTNGTNNESLTYYISSIDAGNFITFNLSVNITDKYYNLDRILANDTLFLKTSTNYTSSKNSSLSRLYLVKENNSVTVQEGNINKQTNGSISINANPSSRIGEDYIYLMYVNFTGAPAENIYIRDNLPDEMEFVSQINTYNNSFFSNTSQLLEWNFGNITNAGPQEIYMNVTVRLRDEATVNAGIPIINTVNMTYTNSDGASILKQDNTLIYPAEPNLIMDTIVNEETLFQTNSSIGYIISLSNPSLGNYVTSAYDILLEQEVPDGYTLLNTSFETLFKNDSLIIWNLTELENDTTINFGINYSVNDFYRNTSNILSNDNFFTLTNISYYAFNNINRTRFYNQSHTSSFNSIELPSIDISNSLTSMTLGEIMYTDINLSSFNPMRNASLTLTIPFGLELINTTNIGNNISYSMNSNTIIWNLSEIFNTNFNARVYLISNTSLKENDLITNRATINFRNSSNSLSSISVSDSISITEPSININIDNIDFIDQKQKEFINISLENIGLSQSYNTKLNISLADGLNITQSDMSLLQYNQTSNTYLYSLSNLSSLENDNFYIEIEVLEKYSNSNSILAMDELESSFRLSYDSFINTPKQKNYVKVNRSSFIINGPQIYEIIDTPFNKNGTNLVRHGDIFNYSIIIDMRNKSLSSPTFLIESNNEIEVISINNSFNNAYNENTTFWNFSSILFNNEILTLNVSSRLLPSDKIFGFENNFNITYTYETTDNRTIKQYYSFTLENAEPMIIVQRDMSNAFPELGDKSNYTLTIINNDTSFTSQAYGIKLESQIPDGLNLLSSTKNISIINHTLIYYVNQLDSSNSSEIRYEFFVNETLKNGSTNLNSYLPIISNITYYSLNNSINKTFFNTFSDNAVLFDFTMPEIRKFLLNLSTQPRNGIFKFEFESFDIIEIDNCELRVTYPNLLQENISTNCNNYSFTNTSQIGNYSFQLFVNDTSGNWGNSSILKGFILPEKNITFTIQSKNQSLNNTVRVFFNDTIFTEFNVTNFSDNILVDSIFDFEIKSDNSEFEIHLNSINTSNITSFNIGIQKEVNIDNYIKTYGVEPPNTNFSIAEVSISYNDISFANENQLKIDVCENWDFNSSTCLSQWSELSAIQDKINNKFIFNRTSFSAFSIYEEIPITSSGGGSSRSGSSSGGSSSFIPQIDTTNNDEENNNVKCVENWSCTQWSNCDYNSTTKRVCNDENSCNTYFDRPDIEKLCIKDIDEELNALNNNNTIADIIENIVEEEITEIKDEVKVYPYLIPFLIFIYIVILSMIIIRRLNILKKMRVNIKDPIMIKKNVIKYYYPINPPKKLHHKIFIVYLIVINILVICSIFYSFILGMVIGIAMLFYYHYYIVSSS